MYTSHTRLYVNQAKTRIVPENSLEAAFLLVGAGGTLSDAEARKYGLLDPPPAPAPEPEPAKIEVVAEPEPAPEPATEEPADQEHPAAEADDGLSKGRGKK